MTSCDDGLPVWPAPERNKQPLLQELVRLLPTSGLVLEVASGSGQHGVHFARALTGLTWQPSDCDPENLSLLQARVAHAALPNLRAPLKLDTQQDPWPIDMADAIFNANMIHIAPWSVAQGLMRGAGRLLDAGGKLITYGPYRIGGRHTSESNERFDASLQERDSRWGVRDLQDVERLAQAQGMSLVEQIPMPANNFTLVWLKH